MKKLFIAAAFALATLTGCNDDDTVGHGDVYVAGHQGKLCTGTLKAHTFIFTYAFYVECDNGVSVVDLKNLAFRHKDSKIDSTVFKEMFEK